TRSQCSISSSPCLPFSPSALTQRLGRTRDIIQPCGLIVVVILARQLLQTFSRLPGDAELLAAQLADQRAGDFDGFVMPEGVGGGDADVAALVGVVHSLQQRSGC